MNPRNQFRIDQVLHSPDGEEVVRFSVAGETFEEALASSMNLASPHIETGLAVQVVRIGYWCDKHKCYHDASDQLAAFGPDGSLIEKERVPHRQPN